MELIYILGLITPEYGKSG